MGLLSGQKPKRLIWFSLKVMIQFKKNCCFWWSSKLTWLSRSGSGWISRGPHYHVFLFNVGTVFRGKPLSQSRFCPDLKKIIRSQNFQNFQKRVFSLIFGPKISASSNFRPGSTFLASKITFLEVWYFPDLSVFWSNFRKIRSKFQKINFKFFQNFYFFRGFCYWRALLTTWMADCTLQNINSSIRLAVNSLRKGHFCPQPPKKALIKNNV